MLVTGSKLITTIICYISSSTLLQKIPIHMALWSFMSSLVVAEYSLCTCQLAIHMMRFIGPIWIGLFFWGFYPFSKVCNLLNILISFSCQKKANKRQFCLFLKIVFFIPHLLEFLSPSKTLWPLISPSSVKMGVTVMPYISLGHVSEIIWCKS